MRCWTAHLRDDAAPVLVREGFSWGALCLGPLWLAWHRAWIAAAISAAAIVLILILADAATATVLLFGLAILLAVSGHDLRRWSVAQRGYLLAYVVAARNETEALARLLARRPDLTGRFLPAGQIR